MADFEHVKRQTIPPLQTLSADVPLAYVVAAVGPRAVSVTLSIGSTVTIDSTGLVRNSHGTALFRLSRSEAAPDGS